MLFCDTTVSADTCAAEDVISRLLPSQQAPAPAVAGSGSGPTAPVPPDQMFSHHPSLWASLASPSASFTQHSPPSAQTHTHLSQPVGTSQQGGHLVPSQVKFAPSQMHARHHQLQQHEAHHQRGGKPTPAVPSRPGKHSPLVVNNILPLRASFGRSKPLAEDAQRYLAGTDSASTDSLKAVHCHASRAEALALTGCSARSSNNSSLPHQPAPSSSSRSSISSSPNGDRQSQAEAVAEDGSPGFWGRTAQLAHLVSFPLRISRAYYSYVPVGRQLYLEPQTVSTTLRPPTAHTDPAGVSAQVQLSTTSQTAAADARVDTASTGSSSGGSSSFDGVVQQRKELLGRLWMHRMPTYRARMQQILYAAVGHHIPEASLLWDPVIQPSPDAPASAASAQLSRSHVAPRLEVARAEISACALLGSNQFKHILKVCSAKCLSNGASQSKRKHAVLFCPDHPASSLCISDSLKEMYACCAHHT